MSTPETTETFTAAQIDDALEQFLKWGEETYAPDESESEPSVSGHRGYYNGIGFPARALRYLLARRKEAPAPMPSYLNMAMLSVTPNADIAGMRRCEKLRQEVQALVESRSGGTLEAIHSPENKTALLGAGGYLKVRLCLMFKDNTSEYHKTIPVPEDTDAVDLQAAQDLDAGRTVDGMVLKWTRPKSGYPGTVEVRLIHVQTETFEDAENNDTYVAIRICRTLLKAKLEQQQRNAANSVAQSASTSKT